jgi:hypothetical protein
MRAYAVGLSANTNRAIPPLSPAPRLSMVVLPFANIGGDQNKTTSWMGTHRPSPDPQSPYVKDKGDELFAAYLCWPEWRRYGAFPLCPL